MKRLNWLCTPVLRAESGVPMSLRDEDAPLQRRRRYRQPVYARALDDDADRGWLCVTQAAIFQCRPPGRTPSRTAFRNSIDVTYGEA